MRTIDYTKHAVPDGYVCADCGAFGVKLWREYQTFLDHQVLRCLKCAGRNQNKDVSSIGADGKRVDRTGCRTDQIGWLVPAVPTKDGSYWGYASVPEEGCVWWRRLPNQPGEAEAEYAAIWYRFLGGRVEVTKLLGLIPDEDSRHRMEQLQNLIGPRFEKFAASLPGFLSWRGRVGDSTAEHAESAGEMPKNDLEETNNDAGNDTDLKPCRGCGTPVGSLHEHGCAVEHCPRCGGQMMVHNCVYEVCGLNPDTLEEEHPDIYYNGPTDEMYERWDKEWAARRMPWTGLWPGDIECREYGFWCLWGPDMSPPQQGWVPVPAGTPGATEDLNTLAAMTVWDPEQQKYILRDSKVGDLP